MKRKLKDGFWKKIIAGSLMASVASFILSAVLRTLITETDFQKNLLDYKGTIQFIQSAEFQFQIVVLVLTVLIFGYIISKMGIFENKYLDASSFGVHGTSRWGKFSEVIDGKALSKKNKYKKNPPKTLNTIEKGIVLAKVPNKKELLIVPKYTSISNRNVFCVGSSGAGKTQGYVLNNVINNTEESIIVTDPKGEIYNQTHKIKRDQGYRVYQIDFINFSGNRFNPLDYVNDDQDAQALAKTIASNSAKDRKEDFFHMQAQNLLTGLIILVKSKYKNASMNDVIREFNRISEDEEYLYNLAVSLGEDHPAYQILKSQSVAEDRTRSSILASLAQQTAIFTLKKVSKMTETSDFNFREFQDFKSILYVKIRMDDNPFSPLTATFFDQLISVLYTVANEHHSVLPRPVLFILDEFANIGKIEKYPRVLATCRGLGMSCSTIVQDLGQIEALYGKEIARTIINNHDIKLFLRTNDTETAKYFSQMAGETTVKMSTRSSSQQGGILSSRNSSSKSSSEQYVKRPLITEGELMNVDRDTCYVFIQGYYPFKCEKAYQFKVFGDLIGNYEQYRDYLKVLPSNPITSDISNESTTLGNVLDNNFSRPENQIVNKNEKQTQKENESSDQQVEILERDPLMNFANEFLNDGNQIQEPNQEIFTNITHLVNDLLDEDEVVTTSSDLSELSELITQYDQSSRMALESSKSIERDVFIQDNIDAIMNDILTNADISSEVEEDIQMLSH